MLMKKTLLVCELFVLTIYYFFVEWKVTIVPADRCLHEHLILIQRDLPSCDNIWSWKMGRVGSLAVFLDGAVVETPPMLVRVVWT